MKYMTMWSYLPEKRNAAQARFKESGGDKPPEGIKLIADFETAVMQAVIDW